MEKLQSLRLVLALHKPASVAQMNNVKRKTDGTNVKATVAPPSDQPKDKLREDTKITLPKVNIPSQIASPKARYVLASRSWHLFYRLKCIS